MNATAPTLSAAERLADMRHYLNEAHQFAAMSPRGRDCIGIALDMLDDLEADTQRLDTLERLLQDGTLTIRTTHFLSAASRVQISYGSEDPIGDSFGLRDAIDAARPKA